MTRASEEDEDIVSRLRGELLYDVHNWESRLPEEAAQAIIHLRAEVKRLQAEVVNLTTLRAAFFSESSK